MKSFCSHFSFGTISVAIKSHPSSYQPPFFLSHLTVFHVTNFQTGCHLTALVSTSSLLSPACHSADSWTEWKTCCSVVCLSVCLSKDMALCWYHSTLFSFHSMPLLTCTSTHTAHYFQSVTIAELLQILFPSQYLNQAKYFCLVGFFLNL
jgi:hypothetical protein